MLDHVCPQQAGRPGAHREVVVLEHGQDLVRCAAQDVVRLVAELTLDHAQHRLVRVARGGGARLVEPAGLQVHHAGPRALPCMRFLRFPR
jgi:hypothetical protein